MIAVSLEKLNAASAHRPKGYFEEVLKRGRIDGKYVVFENAVYFELRRKFSPHKPVSFRTKSKNAITAASRVVGAIARGRKPTVSDEEQTRRMSICERCEFFTGKTCLKCGCIAQFKTKLATEKCPVGKW